MSALEDLLAVVKKLRSSDGCPWDRAQTHESLRKHLLEETYEVLESLDHLKDTGYTSLKEELGDLLYQILFHSELASEQGAFSFDDVAKELSEKLIRRHPHVFGDQKLHTAEQVTEQWELTKQKEKKKDSALDGIPPSLPALQKSLKVIEKVSKAGFQWENLEGPLEKVKEELQEFLDEVHALGPVEKVNRNTSEQLEPKSREKLEAELGDLFFSLSNIAYFLHINPEDSLRSMLKRFEKRFRHVEKRAKESGKSMKDLPLNELDIYWNEAKKMP